MSRPRGWRGALLPAIVFAAAFLALRDEPIGYPPQGKRCVAAAYSLTQGAGFLAAPGTPFARHAPLYPVLLAAPAAAGMDAVESLYLVNTATLAASLLGVAVLCAALGLSGRWAAVALFGVLATQHTLLRMARPDAIPIAASLFALAGAIRYGRSGSRGALLLAAAACALAATARYFAVFSLLPVVLAAVVLARRRVADTLLFLAVAALPIAAWLARNLARTGHLTGMSRTEERVQAGDLAFGDHLRGLVETLYLDLFGHGAMGVRQILYAGEPAPNAAATAVSAALFLACFGGAAWASRRELAALVQGDPAHGLRVVAAYAASHVFWLLALWTFGNNDPINSRNVAPLYAALLPLGIAVWTATPRERRRVRTALVVAALAIAVPNVAKSARVLAGTPGSPLVQEYVLKDQPIWVSEIRWDERAPGRRAPRGDR